MPPSVDTKPYSLFIGLLLPPVISQRLGETLDQYRPSLKKEVRRENWHVTLLWLGHNVAYKKSLPDLTQPLVRAHLTTLTLTYAGRGPQLSQLWAYLHPSNVLKDLVAELAERVRQSGLEVPHSSTRQFMPHIRLGDFSEADTKSVLPDSSLSGRWVAKKAYVLAGTNNEQGKRCYTPLGVIRLVEE